MMARLICNCCGQSAGNFAQWWNRDSGYGQCGDCTDSALKRGESLADIRQMAGDPGTHRPMGTLESAMARYAVTTLDCAADGMERLRSQREVILVAYLSAADATPESLLADLIADIDSAAFPEDSNLEAARAAVTQWAHDGGRDMIAREWRYALDSAERGELNWNDESADESDSVAFRLYIEESE